MPKSQSHPHFNAAPSVHTEVSDTLDWNWTEMIGFQLAVCLFACFPKNKNVAQSFYRLTSTCSQQMRTLMLKEERHGVPKSAMFITDC